MTTIVALVKAIHIAAVALWAAGLIALPLTLARHRSQHSQEEYQRVRRFSHYCYTHLATPAAVTAVAAGIALLFLRQAFVPWMFAKLVLVSLLVLLHAWIGRLVVRMGEHENRRQPTLLRSSLYLALVTLGVIAILVLAKPDATALRWPDWLSQPRENYLPVDEVPT